MHNVLELTLAGAIALAEAHNPNVRAATASTVAAAAQLRAAQGDRMPSATLQDTYQYANPVATLQTPIGPLPFAPKATNVPLLAVRYTVYDGGIGAASVGRAAAKLSAAQADEYESRSALVARVTAAYVAEIAALDAERVLDRAVVVSHADLHLTRIRFQQGMVPNADVLQAQAQEDGRKAQAVSAHGEVAIARARLAAAIGVALSTDVVISDVPENGAEHLNLQAAIASGIASRGELRSAKAALDAARYALEQAKSAQRPTAQVFASDGNVQPTVDSRFIAQFSVGLQAVWKIFDGGATAARIAAASAGVERAKAAYEAARTNVELAVREAYARARAAREATAADAEAVTASQESARLARLRYREGVGTQLELQQAELELADSRLLWIQERTREISQTAQLRFAAGLL